MEYEYWWLLAFPLFFGLGWMAARIDIKHLVTESRALPLSYFKGLNFLLNEEPDKAIEAFIEVVKVDPQTIECPGMDAQDELRIDWMRSIRTREPNRSPVEYGARMMVICDLATRSMWDGRAWSFDPATLTASALS